MALRAAGISLRITCSTHDKTPSGGTKLQSISYKRSVVGVTDTLIPILIHSIRDVNVKRRNWGGSQNRDEEEEDGKRKYYVNLGYAITTLKEEAPVMFHREPSFDIYRDDIVFKDPVNTFSGIENYKLILWALRLNTRIFYKTVWVDILRVWQPAEDVIMIRWTVHGIPRVAWDEIRRGRLEGTSEYKIDRHGKIYEHRVDNVAVNSPPNFRSLHLSQLLLLSFGVSSK